MEVAIAGLAMVAAAGFRVLEYLDMVPFERWRRWIAASVLAVLVATMTFAPSAFNAAVTAFANRISTEMLEKIQPALDDLVDQDEPDPVLDDRDWFTLRD